jgi:hypothetical protein
MAYGTLKVDNIIFTNGGVDQTITVSGIVASTSGNLTATGTISGAVIRGGTLVSGATVTGAAGQFTNITASGISATTITGTTVTGTTATFASGIFTTLSGGTQTVTSGVFALGTAAAPSISFATDSDTGIYSPGAEQVAISTNGVERVEFGTAEVVFNDGGADYDFRIEGDTNSSLFFVDASADAVGIGTTSPSNELHIASASNSIGPLVRFQNTGTTSPATGYVGLDNNNVFISADSGGGIVSFRTGGGSEKARIDPFGRLLVGTSTARGNFYNSTVSAGFQLEGTGTNRRAAVIGDDFEGVLILASQKSGAVGGNTVLASGDPIGAVTFQGSDGTEFVEAASITAYVDGTPGANDMPGRLVFSTTADGASSPTEVMRLTSDNYLRMASGTGGIQFGGDTAAANALDDYEEGTWTPVLSDGTNNATASSAIGHFTKIGNTVSIRCYLLTSSLGSVTGNIRITGLPFTVLNGTYSAVSAGYGRGLALTAGEVVTAYPFSNTSHMTLETWVATTGTTAMTATKWSADGAIIVGLTYQTAT